MCHLLHDLLPVDNSRLDDLVDLEHDESVVEVAVEVVDLGLDAKAVHPVAVHWKEKRNQSLSLKGR